MTVINSCQEYPSPSSYDTLFYRIPSILLTQSSCIRLVHLSDIASCYNQTPSENIEELKQDLWRLRGSVWRFFYLDYQNLIKSSNILLYSQSEANQLVCFYNNFAFELKKVHDFFSVKSGEISRRLAYISKPSSTPMITRFIDIHDAIDELTFDIQDLWHFIKINFRTFLGIVNYLDATLGDGHDMRRKSITQGQQNDMEKNLLLQRLYRLLVPDQFLDLDLFLHWCLELGSIYHDQFDKNSRHYSSTCFDDNNNIHGSSVLSPPSPPPTLYATIMTRDSSNASTGSLPSSSAPPSPTLAIPSINDQSNLHTHYNNDGSFQPSLADFPPDTSSRPGYSATQTDNTLPTQNNTMGTTHSTNDTVYTFWIHPDNLLEVTMYLSKYMDVIKPLQQASHSLAKYEIESPEHQSCLEEFPPIPPSSSHRPFQHWQPITTLYMDTPDLASYTNRIRTSNDIGDSDNASDFDHDQNTVPSLRLRKYNTTFSRTNDTNHLTTQFCSSAGFYALEKKIYVDKPWQSSATSTSLSASSISFSSTCTGDTGIKKLGKKSYRRQHRRPEPSPSWSSIHSRIWLKSKRCKSWMNHQWSLKNVLVKSSSSHHYMSFGRHNTDREYIEQQILEMESDLQTHKLEPVLKTSFNRIGFTWTGDRDNIGDQQKTDVTITIDTDITMTRYDANQVTKDPLQQDDYSCATAPSNDLSRFPFALLRVKLAHDSNGTGVLKSSSLSSSSSSTPSFTASCSWLGQILSCPLLEPIQNFSLYLHGASILCPHKIGERPYWHNKMDLDLQRTDNQGHLSGMRRAYHHQHHRQHSNKSSSQDSASDQASPWSFTNTTLTVSSTKGSSSPNQSETRATTPEPLDTTCTEVPHPHLLLPHQPFEHESNPTINYYTCTTNTINTSSSNENINQIGRKPSILLSPAPVASAQVSPPSSLSLLPSPTPMPDERTPLLSSPNGSTKGIHMQCDCSINNEPTSSTSTLQSCHHIDDHHDHNSISPSYGKHVSSTTFFSSNKWPQKLYKAANWIQPRLSAIPWFRSNKSKGWKQQQHQSDDFHISIDIPNDHIDANTSTAISPSGTYDLYYIWSNTMMMARRPIPLTLLCGLGSFIVACILYLIVSL